jgi:DNA-binding response OmpR family regulator
MNEKSRILYVEDDETLSFVTKDNLEIHGYLVDHCINGEEAVELFSKNAYDLCILDVMLPKMDGYAVAEKIRETDPNIPILFLTAKSMKDDRIHGLKIGGDDYITKPFSIEELILKIEVFLRRKYIVGRHRIRRQDRMIRGQLEGVSWRRARCTMG